MQVTLTKNLEEFITRKVQTGGYANPSCRRSVLRPSGPKQTNT